MRNMWKDIKGYEGLYQVNESGDIKSLARHVENGSPKGMWLRERILKPHKNPRNGYYVVALCRKHVVSVYYVHRIVACAFLDSRDIRETVNHKDGNKANNSVENLEYATYSENNQHAYDTGLHSKKKRRLTPKEIKRIRIEAKKYSRYELSLKYHVSKSSIDNLLSGKTWKNIA